jgi:hypothetical protein
MRIVVVNSKVVGLAPELQKNRRGLVRKLHLGKKYKSAKVVDIFFLKFGPQALFDLYIVWFDS